MSALLDPWNDARVLAQRLRLANTRLVVVLGAEAWCEKCRQFRPIFEASAAEAAPADVWLWLDLEEHAEFLGDYLPPDLPQLVLYASGRFILQKTLAPRRDDLDAALRADSVPQTLADPGLYRKFLNEDWAE